MPQVSNATKYHHEALSIPSAAASMLLRQFQFPDTYESGERLRTRDFSNCPSLRHRSKSLDSHIMKTHTGMNEDGLEYWIKRIGTSQIFRFLKEIMEADKRTKWTGFRITASNPNGNLIWTFELFSKNPRGNTMVYTGSEAPNVK